MSDPVAPEAKILASVHTVFRVEEDGNSVEVTLAGSHSTEKAIEILEEALRQVKARFKPQREPAEIAIPVNSIGLPGSGTR
jgi:hypothetical protein